MTKQERCTETRHACGSNFSNEAIELYGECFRIPVLGELEDNSMGSRGVESVASYAKVAVNGVDRKGLYREQE